MLVLLRYPSPLPGKEESGFHCGFPVCPGGSFPVPAWSPGALQPELGAQGRCLTVGGSEQAEPGLPAREWGQRRPAAARNHSYSPLQSPLGSRERLEKPLSQCNLPGDCDRVPGQQ